MDVRLSLDLVRAWVTTAWNNSADTTPTGGDVPGWVLVTAITVALAIAIGLIIVNKVTDKANSINLQ